MIRTVCVVQARMGSARLPGKSLRPLQGRPLIAHVIERARAVAGVDEVVVATSLKERDTLLAQVCAGLGVTVVRGSEFDVLARVHLAARMTGADVVVRVTGDCPLLATDVASDVVSAYGSAVHAVYFWNDTARSGFPDGTDVEVFPIEALREADRRATTPTDREHVTPWIRRNYQNWMHRSPIDWSRLKLSVDSEDDYARVGRVMLHLDDGRTELDATIVAAAKAGFL